MEPRDDATPPAGFDPASVTRPDPALLTYYVLVAACTVVGFPFVIVPLLVRYHTLRYGFDEKGVSMRWGILFRREIYLTYRRIQDIHVSRNIVERWLGLAKVAIQTASGASGAEMTIVGVKRPERLRDHLYRQMRGARDEAGDTEPSGAAGDTAAETLALLTEIRDALRRLAAERDGGGRA